MSNMVISHGSSPAAAFQHSPSPDTNLNFTNGTVNQFGGFPNVRQHNAPIQPQLMPDPTGLSFQHQGHPVYSPSPARYPTSPPQLVIGSIPPKSRVETQIPIKMTMFPLPLGVKKLHLPTHTISKPKLLSKPNHVRSPETLELYVQLVCTSAMLDEEKKRRALARAAIATHNFTAAKSPSEEGGEDEDSKPQNGGEVKICAGCITRERKRAARKKVKKPEEEELWNRYESQRVIVFNTNETKEWQPVTSGLPEAHVPTGTVEIDAPMRIACYCRHQSEKMGFQVIFTIRDYQDNVVCQQLSPSIMITDDHKTHLPASQSSHASNNADGTTQSAHKPAVKAPTVPQAAPLPHAMASTPANPAANGAIDSVIPFRQSQSTSDLQHLARTPSGAYPVSNPANASISQATSSTATPRNLSRQASPTAGVSGPLPKKRKASGSINKVPSTLAMTRLETQPPTSQPTIPVWWSEVGPRHIAMTIAAASTI
jgi:hypothetical protein